MKRSTERILTTHAGRLPNPDNIAAEPPELVAHRIVRYTNILGRENVIAGTHCGYGNRVYPDIAWAKMKAMAAGAALASQQLWRRSS